MVSRPRSPERAASEQLLARVAQFIGVCSNAKTYEIGENLLSVANPISSAEGMLIHAEVVISLPTLQRRGQPIVRKWATALE
jgi:hypothetical protein